MTQVRQIISVKVTISKAASLNEYAWIKISKAQENLSEIKSELDQKSKFKINLSANTAKHAELTNYTNTYQFDLR